MAQQEAQKSPGKIAAPKPGPAPKGIPQPSILGKAPKEEVAADATIKDFHPLNVEDTKPDAKPKSERAPTPIASAAAPVASELSDSEQRMVRDIEARLSREIEAKLRRELEPRIAKEIELKLMRQFDNQLQRVVNDSVEKAIQRHSQPNLQAISRDEINAFKGGIKLPTPTTLNTASAAESKPERILTPGNIAISRHPSQPSAAVIARQEQRLLTPGNIPLAKERILTPGNIPVSASSSAHKVATPAAVPVTQPSSSPAQELAPVVIPQESPASTTPLAAEPQENLWAQDPSLQKGRPTQQIRVSKIRVSLDDVSPERLIGPSNEDLGKEFLQDAGVSRTGRTIALLMLLMVFIGGGAFGLYYVQSQQAPNPPRVEPFHAAIAGVERGTVRFLAPGPDSDVLFQPPTMLLGQGKIKKVVTAPKAVTTPVAAPKVATPPVTPPKPNAPKLQVVPRNE